VTLALKKLQQEEFEGKERGEIYADHIVYRREKNPTGIQKTYSLLIFLYILVSH
jgi:hypothetical protein